MEGAGVALNHVVPCKFNRWLVLVVLASSGARLHFEGTQTANSSNVKHYNYVHLVNLKQLACLKRFNKVAVSMQFILLT